MSLIRRFHSGDDANESKRNRGDEDENVELGGPTAPPPVTLGPRVDRVSTATPLQDFQALLSQQPFNFFACKTGYFVCFYNSFCVCVSHNFIVRKTGYLFAHKILFVHLSPKHFSGSLDDFP
jgi:hypothetical protein